MSDFMKWYGKACGEANYLPIHEICKQAFEAGQKAERGHCADLVDDPCWGDNDRMSMAIRSRDPNYDEAVDEHEEGYSLGFEAGRKFERGES